MATIKIMKVREGAETRVSKRPEALCASLASELRSRRRVVALSIYLVAVMNNRESVSGIKDR